MIRLILLALFLLLTARSDAQDTSMQNQLPAAATTHDQIYNDDNYKWGIFYFCREDKRMFPPKRSGLGWTINFANSGAVVITVLTIVLLFGGTKYYKSYVAIKRKTI